MRRPVAVTALLVAGAVLAGGPGSAQERVNLDRLGAGGESWKVAASEENANGGFVRAHHEKWLMYFLHWRPLAAESEAPSVGSVRQIMGSFWGPSMRFEFTGNEGPLTVHGHPAISVEGTLGDGAIKTRFVVWNCPQSGRQFIADENINLSLATPEADLDLQREMTRSVACHPGELADPSPDLPVRYEPPGLGFSLSTPASWHTCPFQSPSRYPKGVSRIRGSIWSLLTDSEKQVELHWAADRRKPSCQVLREYLDRIDAPEPPSSPEVKVELAGLEVSSCSEDGGVVSAAGRYRVKLTYPKAKDETPFVLRAWLWRAGDDVNLLVAAMAAHAKIWGIANDLTPSTAVFDTFVREQVWPAVGGRPAAH